MPIVGSGTVSLLALATEFGGSTPHSLSEYYRTPSGPVPRTETSVPTSGLISLSQFYGTERVNASSVTYNSPGTYYLAVPAHNFLYTQSWGAGGGGGGSWYDAGFAGTQGGDGGHSYVSIPTYGTTYGFGGGGGPTWLAGSAAVGSASGGNNQNVAGSGMGGGAGGVYGASFGANGGNGGFSECYFTFGVTSGAPGQGVTLTIVVGAGGAGGFGQSNGSPGSNGQVTIGWS
jgi:hypothetical protein